MKWNRHTRTYTKGMARCVKRLLASAQTFADALGIPVCNIPLSFPLGRKRGG